ncbi:MAG: M6 family metalloprotease domain-containing protein [Bacteroidota bacterium]
MLKRSISFRIVATLLLFSLSALLFGVPKRYVPMVVFQPDGTKIECYASGDEFHNWLHDADGYTIVQHPKTGYFVYAIKENGKLVASDMIVGKAKPTATKGLEPFTNITREEYIAKRKSKRVDNHYLSLTPTKGASGIAPLRAKDTKEATVMNNIVIFIRFADDNPGDEPIDYYQNIYNGASMSVTDYYNSVSYGKFTISTTFYPTTTNSYVVWYQDSQNRNYYRPYNAQSNTIGYDPDEDSYANPKSQTYREHTLLKNAIEAVASQIPSNINLDINNDGYVDVVSFIIAGTNDSWNDLLWPHQWSLWSKTASINGKQVGDYTLQLQFFGNSRIDLGTLCHEMFHAVGSPDLYHYDDNLNRSPVGVWDIMEGTRDEPQNMGAYMKYLYGGWIDNIPVITQTGTYTLNPLSTSATNNCFIIPSPATHTEYFLVEYRKREAYDASLPNDGMLVYRINSKLEGYGNAGGPPDEVYVYRPNGSLTLNGTISNATFNASYGRSTMNDQTNPHSFLSDGSNGGINISNVTAADATISFNATIDFSPWIVLKNDKGYGSAIGNGATTLTVATRFTASDLANHVGKYIKKVDFYIKSDNGNRVTSAETISIWEGGSFGNPGTLVYSQNASAEVVVDQWTTHNVKTPVEIKADKEYWVGYTATATKGYPFATDGGPMVEGKGGWIYVGSQWKQLSEYNLNYNFLIRAIIADKTTDVDLNPLKEPTITLYPNPLESEGFIRIEQNLNATSADIEVVNTLGQVVLSQRSNNLNEAENTVPLNLSRLSKGVYIVRVNLINSANSQILKSKTIKFSKI